MVTFMLCCVVLTVLMGVWVHKKNMLDFVPRHRWYLAGAMSAVSNAEATEWREEAGRHLATINPVEVEKEYGDLVTGDPYGLKERFKIFRKEAKLEQLYKEMQPVLMLDKESVDEAYGLLIRVPAKPRFIWGTVREATIAHTAGKPIVLWCEAKGLNLNNTMVSMATAVRASFESAVAACRKIQIGQRVPLTLPKELCMFQENGDSTD